MSIWAIADLHLSFGTPGKEMDIFGGDWKGHAEKIAADWREKVKNDDLVLIPGDISWAKDLEGAAADLNWIAALPGTKVMIRGNHDYWWDSISKLRKALPPSMHAIANDAFHWGDVSIAGTRLWDTSEFTFKDYIDFKEMPTTKAKTEKSTPEEDEKIFKREVMRLEMSLKLLNPQAKKKIVMTHYPPISADLQDSCVSKLLEQAHVDACVFGHLHSVKPGSSLFGTKNGVDYHFVACDWLGFKMKKIF